MLNILRALIDKGSLHSEQMDRVSRERHSKNIHTKQLKTELIFNKNEVYLLIRLPIERYI